MLYLASSRFLDHSNQRDPCLAHPSAWPKAAAPNCMFIRAAKRWRNICGR